MWHLYRFVMKVSHCDGIVIGMRSLRALLPWSAVFLLSGVAVRAASLQFSASGQFGSAVTPTQLSGPDATWNLSFVVDSNPAAGNVDQSGFDAPFTDFIYSLNNSVAAASPASIRFYPASNLGLFTVFFGPESGFSNGAPIPEFSFEGAQLFSGSTTNPTLLTGTYPISEFIYSANFSLMVANVNVPEPSQLIASLLGLILVGFSQTSRLRKRHQR